MSTKSVLVAEPVPLRNPARVSGTAAPIGTSRVRSLCADDLVTSALEKEGRTSFHDRKFLEPLRRLIHSLNEEAHLSAFGLRAARFDAIRSLTNLLRLDAAEEQDSGIASRVIDRPIFIAGLPRSGTTFLHGLLAQDFANRVPRSWQLIYPYPSRSSWPPGDWRKSRVAVQFAIYRCLAPKVAALHPMSADGPQECSDITAQVFHSLRFDSMYHVPSYQDWIGQHDHLSAYRFHKRFLRHLDRQQPGGRWILKSPDHMFALDAIREVYPDALFVFLHRDPCPVLASQLNLTEALRRSFSRRIDFREIGRSVSEAIVETAQRLVANRARPGVLHLSYRSLVDAPMEAVRRIYAHGGMTLAPKVSGSMKRWLQRQKPRCARRYRRGVMEFGLDAREVNSRFDGYVQTFDVARERTLATRAA